MTWQGDRGSLSFWPVAIPPGKIDPTTLMRIKSLELRARSVMDGFMQGLHKSPHHGSSVEFSEYREYAEGDDTRHIDWKLFARSDRYCIKKFEAETNLSSHLLVDLSGSMGFGSLAYTKAEYTVTLAATFAQFLIGQGDGVGVVTFHEQIDECVPAARKRGQLRSIIVALERARLEKGTDLRKSLSEVAPLLKRRGLVVLFSDLLTDAESLRVQLGNLASRGNDVVVFRVLDPRELSFDFDGAARFRDVETGEILYVDPEQAQERYNRKFGEHKASVEGICSGLGVELIEVSTAESFEVPLRKLLNLRSRLRRTRTRKR